MAINMPNILLRYNHITWSTLYIGVQNRSKTEFTVLRTMTMETSSSNQKSSSKKSNASDSLNGSAISVGTSKLRPKLC